MTSKKSLFILLAVTMIVTLIFTACAPKAEEAPAAVEEEEVVEEAPAMEEEAEEEEAVVEEAAEPVELNVWTRFPEIETWLNKVGEAYTAENPNVTVVVTLFAQRALEEKIAIALPAGEGPDLVEAGTGTNFSYYSLDNYFPMSDELQAYAKDNIISSAFTEGQTPEGEMYTMPIFTGVQMMYYNKDHFAEAGLTEPPETQEELIEYAQKLTKYDDNGNIVQAGLDLRLSGGGFGTAEKFWAMGLVPFGGAPIKQVDGGWVNAYDGAPGEQALQFYLDCIYKYKVDSLDMVSDAEAFGLGVTSMFQRESYVIGYLKESAPDINYGVFPMVKGSEDWGTVATSGSLSIPNSSENRDVAEDFIKFVINEESQLSLLADTGWLPVMAGGDFSSVYAEQPNFEPFVEALNNPDYHVYVYPSITPGLEIVGKMADRLMPAFGQPELMDDPAAVADIISAMAEETDTLLDDYELLAK